MDTAVLLTALLVGAVPDGQGASRTPRAEDDGRTFKSYSVNSNLPSHHDFNAARYPYDRDQYSQPQERDRDRYPSFSTASPPRPDFVSRYSAGGQQQPGDEVYRRPEYRPPDRYRPEERYRPEDWNRREERPWGPGDPNEPSDPYPPRPGDPRQQRPPPSYRGPWYPGMETSTTPAPGVLGGWRSDLQGKQRLGTSTDPPVAVTVPTSYGQVQGFQVDLYDKPGLDRGDRPGKTDGNIDRKRGHLNVFLGIPYAEPPVDEGRFRPPRPSRGWSLWQAVDFGPACPQPVKYTGYTQGVRRVDEDCLYLNVFSPILDKGTAESYPILMYIHGGHFEYGASNTFPAHIMAAYYKVIVVTFNYRLGALGFLSTGDEQSPGNYGLLDQAMALKWVYDNARSFQGNPYNITLFGPGAGAASGGILAVAPRSREMVAQVIAQSGSMVADWAVIQDNYRVLNTSKLFAQRVGCNIDTSYKMINCLRKGRSYQELGHVQLKPMLGTFPWSGVVDGDIRIPGEGRVYGWSPEDWRLLPAHPRDLLQRPDLDLSHLRYLSGVTRDEAAYFVYQNYTLSPNFEVTQKFFDEKIREFILQYNYTLNPDAIFNAIQYMYTYWPDPPNVTHVREQYVQFLSDVLYVAPSDEAVKLLLARSVPIYQYVLNTSVDALLLRPDQSWRAVPHDIEYYFLTGAPFMDKEFFPETIQLERGLWSEGDRNMSQLMIEAFTNFARYGEPTPQSILSVYWEPATKGDLRYLNINHTYNSSMLLNYRQWHSAFWTQYLPTLVGRLLPTYPPITEFWWEPKEPLQIAFWSLAGTCLLLIVVCVACCLLWRSAKRKAHFRYKVAKTGAGREVGDAPAEEPVAEKKEKVATISVPSIPRSPAAPSSRRQTDRVYDSAYVTHSGSLELVVPPSQEHKLPLRMYLDRPPDHQHLNSDSESEHVRGSRTDSASRDFAPEGKERFPVKHKQAVPQTSV